MRERGGKEDRGLATKPSANLLSDTRFVSSGNGH